MNFGKNIEAVIESNPAKIHISVSGFSQENYAITHKGGNIETVKENMLILADAIKKLKASTRIYINYHRYLGNLDDEMKMRSFTENLGFIFNPMWAYLMPLEKVLAFAYHGAEAITHEDMKIIDRLALPFNQAVEISTKHRYSPCVLRDTQMVLDCKGNVILCCTIYDQRKYSLGSFLDLSLAKLQQQKHEEPKNKKICSLCMNKGFHIYATYGDNELHNIGKSNILSYYKKALDQPCG